MFNAATRPHAIQNRSSGSVGYAYDADGNVTSIVEPGNPRYFQFDSANRLICVDTIAGGCGVSDIHYDVDGRRVLDDDPQPLIFVAYVDDSVKVDFRLAPETRIEIWAFGERIAFKTTTDPIRLASVWPLAVPPGMLPLVLFLGLAGLLGWGASNGALVLVVERPGYAGVSAVLVFALVLAPIPLARAGGGGGTFFFWELADRLGTGMVMLDETGARLVHRTYAPFGMEHASAGNGGWFPSHFGGHLKDDDSGLVYMQARWMDPGAGVFLSVDPVVADAFDPQSMNAYAYARNNPVAYTDPTGMFWDLPYFSPGFAYSGIEAGIQTFTFTGIDIDIGTGFSMPTMSTSMGGLGSALGLGFVGSALSGTGIGGRQSQSGVQFAQAGQLTPEQARRMIANAQNPHPGVSPGFDSNRSLQTEVFGEVLAETYLGAAALAGGALLGPEAAAGGLARSPAALTFGSAFTVGFTEGFNAGVPGGPRVFARVPGAPTAINAGLIGGRIAGKAASFAGRFDPAAFSAGATAAADRILGLFR